ncbi:MAG TPA: hypothetical protein VK617_03530 [Gemmatimonadaceae bacterium]|nr:hypothetical protein [Gemmatimonadaceae bacterium]
MMMHRYASVAAAIFFPLAILAGPSPTRPTIAVAPVILHNMSALPDTREDSAAILQLTTQARTRLDGCGYPVVSGSAPSITTDHPGASYLWEHSDVVAQWGAAQHADWVLLSRLNRIGPWVAEWEVQVVSTRLGRAVDTRVVELKGLGRDTTLTAHMSARGAAWLIDQATQSIAHASGDSAAAGRPCHA